MLLEILAVTIYFLFKVKKHAKQKNLSNKILQLLKNATFSTYNQLEGKNV